jgi:hypothetical protein
MATLARCKSYLDCANTHIVGVLDWSWESKSDRVSTCKDGLEMAVVEVGIGRVVQDTIFLYDLINVCGGCSAESFEVNYSGDKSRDRSFGRCC